MASDTFIILLYVLDNFVNALTLSLVFHLCQIWLIVLLTYSDFSQNILPIQKTVKMNQDFFTRDLISVFWLTTINSDTLKKKHSWQANFSWTAI